MKLKRIMALFCAFALFALGFNTVFAFDGSVFYASVKDIVKSHISVNGTVQDTSKPVNIIVHKSNSDNVSDESIIYINQCYPEKGVWNFTFSVNGSISDYNIILRQDGALKNSLNLEEIYSITDAIDASVTAQIVNDIISADLTVKNPLLVDTNCSLCIALYDKNDDLVTVEMIDINEVSQSKFYKNNFQKAFNNADYAKVYFWSENLTPLTRGIYAKETSSVINFSLNENNKLITKNPGKGWVRYGVNNSVANDEYPEYLDDKAIEYSSVGYMRYNWRDVEIADDVYNWSAIDSAINFWKQRGMKFAFGVMNADTSSSADYADAEGKVYITPKWVFDLGAKYVEGVRTDSLSNRIISDIIPVFDDPIYLKKCEEFANALAERYDGNPDVAWIDIRSYGNYGEFHVINMPDSVVGLDNEGMKKHIDMYADAFDKTQVIVCTGAFFTSSNNGYIEPSYIINKDVGIRHDGANSIQNEVINFHGHQPAISEIGPAYKNYVAQNGWDDYEYLNHFINSKLSYMDIGEWGTNTQAFIQEQEHLIRYLTNKMGYHFVLDNVTMPKLAYVGDEVDIDFEWINKGITYLYENCNIELAILDSNKQVVDKFPTVANPTRNWAPDVKTLDTANFVVGDFADGDYYLAIGLHHDDDGIPDYEIGNFGKTEDKWYIFANAQMSNERLAFSKYVSFDDVPAETIAYPEFANGGFENGFDGWVQNDNLFAIENGSLCFSGNSDGEISTTFKAETNTVYEMSMDIKSNNSVDITIETIDGKTLISKTFYISSSDWETVDVRFDLYDAGKELFGDSVYDEALKLKINGKEGQSFCIDNVTITVISSYEDLTGNGDFIDDADAEISRMKWQRRGTSSLFRTDSDAHSEKYSYEITARKAWDGAQYLLDDLIENGGIGTYEFEAYLRTGKGQNLSYVTVVPFSYNYDSSSGTSSSLGSCSITGGISGVLNPLNDSWRKFESSFEITSDILASIKQSGYIPRTIIGFGEIINNSSGNPIKIYFDDVKIKKVK